MYFKISNKIQIIHLFILNMHQTLYYTVLLLFRKRLNVAWFRKRWRPFGIWLENMEWCLLIQKRLAAFGCLIGKDGMLPDSEKADCLWVFDWKRWNVPSFGNKKRLAAFRYLIGKNGPSTDRTRWKYRRQSKVKLEFLHLHSRNTSFFHFEKSLQR